MKSIKRKLAAYRQEIHGDIRAGLAGIPVTSGRWTYRSIGTAATQHFCHTQRELDQLWCRAEAMETTWRWLGFPSGWWVLTHISNWLILRHGRQIEIMESGGQVISWRIVPAEGEK